MILVAALLGIGSTTHAAQVATAAPSPLRVLLITGRGNQAPGAAYADWVHSFYPSVLRSALGADAVVEVATTPAALTPAKLAAIDVVVNNSLFHEPTRAQFDALFDFVRRGGGFMALHAGNVSFLNDPRYERMLGARFIGHDPLRTFQVEARDNWYGWAKAGSPVHPIAQGLTTFATADELYVQQFTTDDITVVARAEFMPVMWTRQEGRGRVVALTLGHDDPAMAPRGFRHLLRRGVLWSAARKLPPADPDDLG